MANSKIFCNVPWHKIFVRSTGHYTSCCVMQEDLSTATIEQMSPVEWFHSEQANQIRTAMLGDQPVDACSKCYYREQIGYESSRIKDNYKSFIFPGQNFDHSYSESPQVDEFEFSRNNQGVTSLQPRDYMLSLGNECNLACKMCAPIWSSRIADKYKSWNMLSDQLNVRNNWTSNDQNWQRLLQSLTSRSDLVRLTLLGGETTMNKKFYELIDFLIDHDRTDVVLHFITNATIYSQEVIDKLKKFKGLYIEFSLESIEKNNHYIRQGSDTQQVISNILQMQSQLAHNTNFTISSAPQSLSINTYDKLIRWALAHKIPIQGHPVVKPSYFNIAVLPAELRSKILPRFVCLEDELKLLVAQEIQTIAFGADPTRISQVLLNETQSMIKLLQAPEPHNAKQLQQEMIQWMMRWDKEFDLDATDYFPEYQDWLQQMDYYV